MATHVTRSSVTRECAALRSGRPLMVKLTPEGIYLREKGRRTSYLLPYGVGYMRAVWLAANALRAAKAAARTERSKARKAARGPVGTRAR
jgi:hypothetical protein